MAAEPAGRPENGLTCLFIAGNSTASNGAENGWGSHLQLFFDPDRLIVHNRARAGRSSRTYITGGNWDGLLKDLKRGDYVLIQFGHNDAGQINDSLRARGSLPGLGEETREIQNCVTGKHEVVHTFGWYMQKMIDETLARGATPVVLSMTTRNVWAEGHVERENPFCTWSRELATLNGAAFIDLRNMIADQYELLGPVRVRELFPVDHTHTGPEGALLNAALVVSGLKTLDIPLAALLSDTGKQLVPYGPNVFLKQGEDWMTSAWMPEVQPEPDSALPTLFLIGNSTVRNGTRGDGANGEWGWGAPIADFFDRSRLNVENRALGGRSSRTFRTQGLWQAVLEEVRAGDYVIMQFGHNDSSPVNDTLRARGTLPGNGDEIVVIDNMLTGMQETVHSYGWYIRQYIKETRAKGAVPVVCSPIPRNLWKDGRVERPGNSYIQWAEEAAREEGACFIDLNQWIVEHYNRAGEERVKALYFAEEEVTHTNALGARMNAACLVEGIKATEGLSLAGSLKQLIPQ